LSRIYYDADVDPGLLLARRIAVIGYGSQGRAQALNLRDSGCDVVIGARPDGRGWLQAANDGFDVRPVKDAAAGAALVVSLVPEQDQASVYRDEIRPVMDHGSILFSHGFAYHYGQVVPPPDVAVLLVAPIGPGSAVRRQYELGRGVPAVFAVAHDPGTDAEGLALAYACAIGSTRAGVIRSTFAEETETDLFGEQAILCGGIPYLMRAGFQTLIDAGYQPELAFFECIHQVKLIVDLIHRDGFEYLYRHISDTAEFGALTAGPRIVDASTRQSLRAVLADIQGGDFARRWIAAYTEDEDDMLSDVRRDFGEIDALGGELRRRMHLDGD